MFEFEVHFEREGLDELHRLYERNIADGGPVIRQGVQDVANQLRDVSRQLGLPSTLATATGVLMGVSMVMAAQVMLPPQEAKAMIDLLTWAGVELRNQESR